MSNLITFSDLLKKDQNIVESRLDQFEEIGILELFDRIWRRIKRHRILPIDDPMTHELNKMMEQASSKLRSNLQSVAGHIEEDFEFQEPRVEISVKFLINELNPSIESIWKVCSYILTAMYHMARLFAESFSLPKGSWH